MYFKTLKHITYGNKTYISGELQQMTKNDKINDDGTLEYNINGETHIFQPDQYSIVYESLREMNAAKAEEKKKLEVKKLADKVSEDLNRVFKSNILGVKDDSSE